jgi:hypothetical protein
MARTREFTRAKKDDATIPLGALKSFLKQSSRRQRVLNLYPALFGRYVDISETRKPLITTFRQETLKRIITEAFCTNAALKPNIKEDGGAEALLPLR